MANPKKAQNIGIGRFRRQGVAHNTQPGSAAALLSQKAADQRLQEWLRGKAAEAPVEAAKAKGKRKRKGKKAAEEEKAGGDTPAETGKDGNVASKGEQKGQEAAAKNAITEKAKQNSVSTVVAAPAPIRKLNQTGTYTSARRLTASSGPWGKQIVESAERAALMATATAYEDVTTMAAIKEAARALAATAESQRQSQSASQKDIPYRSIMQSEVAPFKRVRNSAIVASSSRKKEDKVQRPMWSDDEDDNNNDQDDFEDNLVSSKSTKSNAKATRRQTATSSNTNRKTALSGKKKGHRVQSTPQHKSVRFSGSASSTESDDKVDKSSLPKKSSKPSSKRQTPRMSAPSTFNPPSSTSSNNGNNSNINSNSNKPSTPSQSHENLTQGELSDDEASLLQTNNNPETSPSKPIHPPIPQYQPPPPRPAPKETPPKQQQRADPSRKKGVARKPEPKRAQAPSSSSEDESDAPTKKRTVRKRKRVVSSSSSSSSSSARSSDSSDNEDDEKTSKTSSPANKKSKPNGSAEKPKPQPQQPTPKTNGPPRKKGVASKPVQRKRAPQY
jgi:hypothetical protein